MHHHMRANKADKQFCIFDAGHYTPREGPRYPLHKRLGDGEGHSDVLGYDAQIFQKSRRQLKISRRQRGEIKQVPHCGLTNTSPHRTNFSRPGDMAPRICAPLL
jgi:hypothetical protein